MAVKRGVELLVSNGIARSSLMAYMLVGFNTSDAEDDYRFRKLREMHVDMYAMLFNKGEGQYSARLGHWSRWINGRIYKVCDFEQYVPWQKAQQAQTGLLLAAA